MHFNTLTLAAILAATASALAPTPTCYNHPGPLQRFEGYDVVSLEQCSQICQSQSMPIAGAMNGNECWCGKAIPAPENIVPGNSCDSPCVGTPGEMCMYLSSV